MKRCLRYNCEFYVPKHPRSVQHAALFGRFDNKDILPRVILIALEIPNDSLHFGVLPFTGNQQRSAAFRGPLSNALNTLYAGTGHVVEGNTRALEGDHVTVYGTSQGVETYQSTQRKDITIPSCLADAIVLDD